MENQTQAHQRKGQRLVLFPLPLQGHINPMLQLANILHSKGFSITIIHTHFNSPNPSNYPHLTFISIPDGLSESESESATKDVLSLLSLLNVNCLKPFQDCLGKLLGDVSEEEPIVCLISDAILHFTREVAESFKLPRLVLRTGGVSSFLAFAAFPDLLQKGYLPIQDSQLEDLIPDLPPLRIKDLPVINTPNPDPFYQLLHNMIKETKSSSGLIWNSFEELEQPSLTTLRQEFPIPIFPLGPFHKYFPASSSRSSFFPQDPSSISWLDKLKPRSVIYVSYGSLAAMDENQFLEIAWGLANCNHPFLWVVRPGLVRGSEWLELLPSGFLESLDGRGHIVKWAPQQEVLAHPAIGVFWTHNGWNSTMESICEGVPMICLPCFSDQMVNARYVSHVWRVGLQLEACLERGEIEKVIRRVMVEREGEEIRERSLVLKKQVHVCLRQGGSSYESLESLINFISSF